MSIENPVLACQNRAEILSKVKRIIIDNLNLDLVEGQIDDDSPLFGTGLALDSIDALDLVIGIEEGFSIKVGEDELHVFKSVNSLVDFIIERQNPASEFDAREAIEWSTKEIDPLQILDSGLREAYRAVRTGTVLTSQAQTILRFPEGEETLEALGSVLSGKLLMMEPNKILHTALIDAEGKTADLVYVFQFEGCFWVVVSEGNRRAVGMLRDLAVECDEISGEYGCILMEGPYSWALAKEVFGFEVLGLSYQRFIELEFESSQVVLARLSTTGEYGFRIYAPASSVDAILEALRQNGAIEFTETTSQDFAVVQAIAGTEMRSSIFGVTVPEGSHLPEYELRWMIDPTNERISSIIPAPSTRVVGIKIEGGPAEEEIAPGTSLLLDGTVVGAVRFTRYSPVLGCQIGYAAFEAEYGYAGLRGLAVDGEPKLTASTQSTPFFLPASSRVQMQ